MTRTGELYIFGDSLSDDGATATQSGENPVTAFTGGRASNGPVWHEFFRDGLAVAPRAAAISQAPDLLGFLGGSDLNGVNFAHSGAVSSEDNFNKPGALQQAQGFAALVASGAIAAPDDQDVFVIWIGGNDILGLADDGLSGFLDVFTIAGDVVDNIERTVDALAATGAQNFLLVGQPEVGGAFLGDRAPARSILARLVNEVVDDFNDDLEDYADELNATGNLNALYIDIATAIKAIEADPAAFGFSNVTSDILTDGAPFTDQSYFSADGIHPTGAGHRAIANAIVAQAEAAGFDLTALAGNVLPGSERADTLLGTGGNDSLTGGAADDVLMGAAGQDIAFYAGADGRYTLSIGPNTTLTDRSGAEGTDTLTDIETLRFSNGDFALSAFVDAGMLAAEAFRDLVEMYVSYYNRAPDALGLTFWANTFANGLSLNEIATFFAEAPEAQAALPPDMPIVDFVNSVYNNTIGRLPDEAGAAFWTDMLTSGAVSRPQFILEVLNGVRADPPGDASDAFVAQQAEDQAYLDAKTDLGIYFAAILGLSDAGDAAEVMGLFDGSTASLTSAKEAADIDHAAALAADGSGAFLVTLVGVVDDPFLAA